MKYLLLLLLLSQVSCKRKPEFYINDKPYYTQTYCIKNHQEKETGYHWGHYYSFFDQEFKFGYHWEHQCMGRCEKTVCDQYKTDTIEIKTQQ